LFNKLEGAEMRRNLALAALAALLVAGCVSQAQEYSDPPCGVKETEAGLCKEPAY
jgi:hypothetical protein